MTTIHSSQACEVASAVMPTTRQLSMAQPNSSLVRWRKGPGWSAIDTHRAPNDAVNP